MIIWNFKAEKTLYGFPFRRAQFITALALAPGGEFLLLAKGKTLGLWKLTNGECVEDFHFDQHVLVIACGSNGMVWVGLKGGRLCFLRFNDLSSDSGQLTQ